MNPWRPDDNPLQTRRCNKTAEEASELIKVLMRINMQGLNGIDPESGKPNRVALCEEIADCRAQFEKLEEALLLPRMREREERKMHQMDEWEEVLR